MKLNVGMIKAKTYNCYMQERSVETVNETIDKHPDLDILIAPEWFHIANQYREMYTKNQFIELKKTFEEKTKDKDMLLIPGTVAWSDGNNYRNSALIIDSGKTIKIYSKRTDGMDHIFANKAKLNWRRGKKDGLFTWRGLSCGLEICADHAESKLIHDGAWDLDLQFLIACGKTMDEESLVITENKYFLHCDGAMGKSYIKRKEGTDTFSESRLLESYVIDDHQQHSDSSWNKSFHRFEIEIKEKQKLSDLFFK